MGPMRKFGFHTSYYNTRNHVVRYKNQIFLLLFKIPAAADAFSKNNAPSFCSPRAQNRLAASSPAPLSCGPGGPGRGRRPRRCGGGSARRPRQHGKLSQSAGAAAPVPRSGTPGPPPYTRSAIAKGGAALRPRLNVSKTWLNATFSSFHRFCLSHSLPGGKTCKVRKPLGFHPF